MGSRSAGRPNRWTGMMARVFGVMTAAINAGLMLKVTGSMSTKTGFAPTRAMEPAVAMKLKGDVMTSSPGPMPAAIKERTRASVPEAQPMANLAPSFAASSSSRSFTSGPRMKYWLSKTRVTAAITSSRMEANWARRSRKSKAGLAGATADGLAAVAADFLLWADVDMGAGSRDR